MRATRLELIAECEAAHMLRGAAGGSRSSAYRGGVQVLTGFRGADAHRGGEESILDRFFGPEPGRPCA